MKMEQKADIPKMKLSDDDAKVLRRSLKLLKHQTLTIRKGERLLFQVFTANKHPKAYKNALVTLPGFKPKALHAGRDKAVWA